MNKQRWYRSAFIALGTFALLFMAFSGYEQIAIKRPIQNAVAKHACFQIDQFNLDKREIQLQLKVASYSDDWMQQYLDIEKMVNQHRGKRSTKILINVDKTWENTWNHLYMLVSTSIDHHDFAQIVMEQQKWQEMLQIDDLQFNMDEAHLFVMVQKDDKILLQVLPIQSEKGGDPIASGTLAGNLGR
ncbi:hypothetical protein [Rubeoparvulum massiliense]|uniref:hypothetical protein n=1 Tax=Rubeoparvulum massiliense TaxID=1631346 RepID=UPI00065E0B27|nr:hypothetical protein [Rubeoparvulum massiliense]